MATPPLNFLTDAEVIEAFGGEAELRQCLNVPDAVALTSANVPKLRQAIEDACGDIAASAGNQFKIWLAQNDPPQWIRRLARQRAVYYLWGTGTHGKAIPENVRQLYSDTTRELIRVEEGKKFLGADPNPAARRVGPVDNSDCGRRAVWRVFRRAGFLGGR